MNFINDYHPAILTLQNILEQCATAVDKIDCAKLQLANSKHLELTSKYREYNQENIDINSFLQNYGPDVYLESAVKFQSYIEDVGVPPRFPYKWQLMAEEFIEAVGPILPEFIPTIDNL